MTPSCPRSTRRRAPGWSRRRRATGFASTSGFRATARRRSSPSDVFEGIFVPDDVRAAVSDAAWLQALLDAERALAAAEAQAGLISSDAAEAIAAACRAELYDAEELAAAGRAVGNPVEPLVRALGARAGDSGRYVHRGATSQDILDTAAMLVTRRALDPILAELARVAAACASLAEAHRSSVMPARTLLQHAVPTTFGAKVAGW